MKSNQTINWEAWKKTEEGKRCLAEGAVGKYLENRLWWAYMAGYEAAKNVYEKEPEEDRPITP